ncbi:MAG: BatD family protein [Candidatus Rifleibacteriota bacterium]
MYCSSRGKQTFLAILTLFLLGATALYAQYEIKAEVDRTEVAFGEALTLAVTITQELGAGGNVRMMTPNIEQIPGFDIASSRSNQSTRFINNYGYARNQIVFELVPREPGKKTIPAISFKDPEGKMHSTDPIEITVLPSEKTEQEPEDKTETKDEKESGGYLFKGLLIAGIVFVFLIAIPFVLSSFFSNNKESSVAEIEQTSDSIKSAVTEAEIIEEKVKNIVPDKKYFDFSAELAELKKRYQEFDKEFCGEYFALFKKAAVNKNSALSKDMTPDELMKKITELSDSKGVKEAGQKLAIDIEMVMYAGQKPARNFKAIEEDVGLVLRAIED